ncbi:glycoside hydrolase [Christensenellaceae bacterium OttesenSCG-928-M15]|nr:glycoside hydrolase [Christensenellaceae bacterium OttesenSCG-928-M15]
MHILSRSILYENPLPQLESRQSMFPSLLELDDGSILATHVIGEAFESVNSTTCLSISHDGGSTFSFMGPLFKKQPLPRHSDCCKLSRLQDGRLCAFGYAYDRKDPALPVGNPKTGGLLEDKLFVAYSHDEGKSFSSPQLIDCAWGPHVEASAPLYPLKNGSLVSPITGFASWEGRMVARNCGRLLRSDDHGKTFSDDAVCMAFDGDEISCFEQRLCELDDGTLVVIGWNEHLKTGELFANHYTLSSDGGKTFCAPRSTGVFGQASSVFALGATRLLALHAMRRNAARPGIYAYVVDLAKESWEIEEELLIFEPQTPIVRADAMADIFAYLRFGQPSAIRLRNGSILCCYWAQENGQYTTNTVLLEL